MNKPRIMYAGRSVEAESLSRKIMVHTAMHYKCEVCGTIFRFWLEKGLEDRKQDEINPKNHKPVPFCIACLCGGTAQHFAWSSDIRLDDYRELKEDENYFENTETEDCGLSHFRNNGSVKVASPDIEKFLQGVHWKTNEEREKEIQAEELRGDFEDDPYGLAYVSTTTLKAELRRRKRWK